jgi:hypothetical protein
VCDTGLGNFGIMLAAIISDKKKLPAIANPVGTIIATDSHQT